VGEIQILSHTAGPRSRLIDAAYALFTRRGIRAVSVDDILAASGATASQFDAEFASIDDLVVAVLDAREQRWTFDKIEAGARAAGATPEEQLLGIFDVFDDWFHADDYEGCTFISVLLELGWDHPAGRACIDHLSNIRDVVARLARDAGVTDPSAFAHSWHILMKGSIISATEGDLDAAKRAREMAADLLARSRGRTDITAR
jgi:AcrR family transcriptional regulator